MTTKKVTAPKGGPADPSVSAVIAAARQPQPEKKTAAELKPGDWLAPIEDLQRGACEVLQVFPYRDMQGLEAVFLTYQELGEYGPNAEHAYAGDEYEIASGADVDRIKAQACGLKAAMQLRRLADLIVSHELPVQDWFRAIEVTIGVDDLALIEKVSEALGIPVYVDGAGRHEVRWPGTAERSDAHGNVVVASWFTYPKHHDPEYAVRNVDEEQTGEPVPADVEGVSVGAGAVRQVSAPPAGA